MTSQRDPAARRARRFGHVRSLVHGAPSEQSWTQLCALLASWPEDELDEIVAYVAPSLSAWPVALRALPQTRARARWLECAQLRGLIATLGPLYRYELEMFSALTWPSLCALEVRFAELKTLREALSRFDVFAQLESLSLSMWRECSSQLLNFLGALPWGRLRELKIDGLSLLQDNADVTSEPGWADAMFAQLESLEVHANASAWPRLVEALEVSAHRLTHLKLTGPMLDDDERARLLSLPLWGGLKVVGVTCVSGDEVIDALVREGALPQELALLLSGDLEGAPTEFFNSAAISELVDCELRADGAQQLGEILAGIIQFAPNIRRICAHKGALTRLPDEHAWTAGRVALDMLELFGTDLDEQSLAWLHHHGFFASCQELNLLSRWSSSSFGVKLIDVIAQGQALKRLRLTSCGLNPSLIVRLLYLERLQACERIVLSNARGSQLPEDHVALAQALLDPEILTQVKHLSLAGSARMIPDAYKGRVMRRFQKFLD